MIVGKTARHVPPDKAYEYVAGYSCFGDHTLRDYTRHERQVTPGKNFHHSGAFGPWLVTVDEIPDPTVLQLTGKLNGEVMQSAPVSDLIFDIPFLISYLSSWSVLKPGDVIATGTPSGVGFTRTPPLWMKAGDVFEIEISQIGVLRNTVVDEERPPDYLRLDGARFAARAEAHFLASRFGNFAADALGSGAFVDHLRNRQVGDAHPERFEQGDVGVRRARRFRGDDRAELFDLVPVTLVAVVLGELARRDLRIGNVVDDDHAGAVEHVLRGIPQISVRSRRRR